MISETGGHDVYPTPCRDLCPRQHPGQQPENQLAELRKYVQARGWSAHEYTDQGISGAKEKRPALDALIRDAKRRKFDVLACWRLDRFGRSLKHLVTLLDELQVLGIAFVSLAEGIDATTPAGKLQMHILAAIAEFERARITERVTAGLARARQQGRKLGRPERIVPEALLVPVRGPPLAVPENLSDFRLITHLNSSENGAPLRGPYCSVNQVFVGTVTQS